MEDLPFIDGIYITIYSILCIIKIFSFIEAKLKDSFKFNEKSKFYRIKLEIYIKNCCKSVPILVK